MKGLLPRAGLACAVSSLVVWSLAPAAWQVLTALKPDRDVARVPTVYLPHPVTLEARGRAVGAKAHRRVSREQRRRSRAPRRSCRSFSRRPRRARSGGRRSARRRASSTGSSPSRCFRRSCSSTRCTRACGSSGGSTIRSRSSCRTRRCPFRFRSGSWSAASPRSRAPSKRRRRSTGSARAPRPPDPASARRSVARDGRDSRLHLLVERVHARPDVHDARLPDKTITAGIASVSGSSIFEIPWGQLSAGDRDRDAAARPPRAALREADRERPDARRDQRVRAGMSVSGTLRGEGITKVFPGGTRALDGVTFSVGAGRVLTLLGPSGCGKSTLLRIVAGLETATSGALTLDGASLDGRSAGAARRRVRLPELRALSAPERGAKPLARARDAESPARGDREPRRRDGEAPRPRRSSSTGVRASSPAASSSACALGRALVKRPRIYLMDEPLSNLDALPARGDAVRAAGSLRPPRGDGPLRHARPGRSARPLGRDPRDEGREGAPVGPRRSSSTAGRRTSSRRRSSAARG